MCLISLFVAVWAMKTWIVLSKSELKSELVAAILAELVALLFNILDNNLPNNDLPDDDLLYDDLPNVLPFEVFDAEFDPEDLSSYSRLWHSEAMCPLLLQ